jgi:hypothetical protein
MGNLDLRYFEVMQKKVALAYVDVYLLMQYDHYVEVARYVSRTRCIVLDKTFFRCPAPDRVAL